MKRGGKWRNTLAGFVFVVDDFRKVRFECFSRKHFLAFFPVNLGLKIIIFIYCLYIEGMSFERKIERVEGIN